MVSRSSEACSFFFERFFLVADAGSEIGTARLLVVEYAAAPSPEQKSGICYTPPSIVHNDF
jgi:hypothetical protein